MPTVVIDLCEEKSDSLSKQGQEKKAKNAPSSSALALDLVQTTGSSEFGGAQQMDAASGGAEEQFDVEACRNFGKPIMVEWEGKVRAFIDGLGLRSPTRWLPSCRAFYRSAEMKA